MIWDWNILIEKKLWDEYVARLDPKMSYILVILHFTYSPTGIPRQREDSILEWIFLRHKQSKKK